MLLDVRMKIHCPGPFTTLRLIRRANAAEALVAVITLKSTPFLLVITQYVCISQSPQRRKQSEPACFSWEGSGGLCFLALCLGRCREPPWGRGVVEGASCWGLGPSLAWPLRDRLILAGLNVHLFTQNVKAQPALEA